MAVKRLTKKAYHEMVELPPNIKRRSILPFLPENTDVLSPSYAGKYFGGHVYSFGDADSSVLVVGKGVWHDSGGMNLKNWDNDIHLMKHDCAGAFLSLLAGPDRQVVIPWFQNKLNHRLPSGSVVSVGAGVVEIVDTDAEGRVACADAFTLAMALRSKPPKIVVFITTCGMCFLPGSVGFATSDEKLAGIALSQSAEKAFRVPLVDYEAAGLRSRVADLSNFTVDPKLAPYDFLVGASAFLRHFTPDSCRFIHVDVSGVLFENYDHKKACGYDFVRGLLAQLP